VAQLDILYFAWVREVIGLDGETITRPASGTTIGDVVAALAAQGGAYAEALGDRDRLRAAIDQRFAPMDSAVGDARELALFPPVTGG
jgi:molybdopterin synthase sulfur carrier subunit